MSTEFPTPDGVNTPIEAPRPVTSTFAPPLTPEPAPFAPGSEPLASPPTPVAPVPVTTPPAPVYAAPAPRAAYESAPPAKSATVTNPLLTLMLGAILACGLVGTGIVIGRHTDGTGIPLGSAIGGGAGTADNSNNPIVLAVRKVGPAVMNVDTTFGKEDSAFLPAPGEEDQGPREGKGTGVVIDSARGLMLTNAHVVANAVKIQVTTRDGDKYTGRVLGFDRRSDIAVVELSNKHLPQAELASFSDPKQLDIGEWCIAIGNPYAQENTVTVGVLSAIGRTLPVPSNEEGKGFALTDMLQTDAAINPGNSGGPLCDIRGDVIGINTAIIPFAQGLGFSIPINKAMRVADEIIKTGHASHPYIGVLVKPITDGLQSDMGLPDKNGALVQSVEPNSPAAKAGVKAGDVIRQVDGVPMKSNDDVVKAIGDKKVGDTVKLEILRNNAVKQELSFKVGDRPDN